MRGDGEDAVFVILNASDRKVNVEWTTVEGATTCAELLAEGYLQE